MAALLSVADALARVLDGVEPLPPEQAPLVEADGRVLAADLAALRTQPPADLSAMDGYAVRAADVASAPVTLKIAGEVAAGRPFAGQVHAGEAARIFTGGVVPPGADTIVIQENPSRDGERVVVNTAERAGRHIRRAGLDFKEGQVLLRCFLGGTDDPGVLDESDESVTAQVLEELHRIVGFTAQAEFVRIFRWPRAMAQYNVGHQERMAEVQDLLAAIPGLYLAGNAYEGIGIPDCIRTAKQAVESIRRNLSIPAAPAIARDNS